MSDFGMSDLDKKMTRLAACIAKNADKKVAAIAIGIVQQEVQETPVDTGRAKANWQANVGFPVFDAIEAQPPGVGGSTAGANQAFAEHSATARIANFKPSDQAIFITHNLDYIGPLNQGHSAQNDPGWIERAMADGILLAKDIKLTECK